ncbi:BTAD domain-containing putative transcriptional regulator [Virgisporangium aurantiacum]|uniref:BTAD domain-containing putative transcriptional regulator n=1 Tax=Virgisporangium aurantiacum TaxID=175570 RepID=UPI00194DC057|nr:BTAD domain-containing putative transcriptional regulator [Virgisporangium aurantiacum]
MEIGLLGPVLVRVDGAEVRLASTPQRVILARLALAANRTASPAALIDTLWPDGPPANAAGNLHAYVSRLRRAIGADRITREPAGYRLGVAAEQIDIGRAEALVAAARATDDPAGAADRYGAALALWRGEPLADLPDPTPFAPDLARLAAWRRQVRDEWFTARLAAGRAADALPDLEHATTADPDRESLQILLATALHHLDRTADALRVLADHRRRLADEHGLDPGPAVAELTTRLLTGDAPMVSTKPMNRYLGRDGDLAAVEAALRAHRLVTVVGPGGMGKTRLGLELLGRLPAGGRVHVVELALVSRADDVPLAAAAAIGLRTAPGSTDGAAAVIADQLGDGAALVVLDNCEHVRVAARDLVAGLLARCPGLRVLATSRQRLGVAAEKVLRLGPLAPDDQVELFCDRAALLRDDFPDSPETRRLAADICRTLDGLPLAVELAASREAVFGLRQLRDRLAAGLAILEPARDPDRTTAVSATVEWSYRLLDPAAQHVFDALVGCRGGFPLDALAHLAPDVTRPEPLLAELVEASLVIAERSDPPRYRLLEVMRRVGLDHLGPDRLPHARDRHASWMTAHAERCHALQRERSPRATGLLRAELANLLEALGWLIDTRRWADAGRLGALLAPLLSDHPDLALLAQQERLAAAPADLDAETAGRCAIAAGTARWLQGDLPVAERLLSDALTRLPADHSQRWIAQFFRLTTHMFAGHLDAVQADAGALLVGPDVPDWVAGVGVGCAALSHLFAGDRAAGERLLSVHSGLLARVGEADGFVAYTYAEFAADTDPDRALDLFARAYRQSAAIGQRYDMEVAAIGRMAVLIRSGRGAEAARACRASVDRLRTSGMWPQLWTALRLTAELLVALGDLTTAASLLAAAERDPLAPAVVGPDRTRQAALWAAVERGLGADAAAAARSNGGRRKRATVAEHAIAALAPFA